MFSNSYFVTLLAAPDSMILGTDQALVHDPELRPFVELYAQDEARFRPTSPWPIAA